MKLEYFGHSCFCITTSKGTKIITDPYDKAMFPSGLLYSQPTSADIVTVSHKHSDHNYAQGVSGDFIKVDRADELTIRDVDILSLRSYHDDKCGAERGTNLVFIFRFDGLTLCHMGDIGQRRPKEICDKIGAVDILLLPIGGYYTIDAITAKEYVDAIKPKVVAPMHCHSALCDWAVLSDVTAFTRLFEEKDIERLQSNVFDTDNYLYKK
ncbi:MAG: MBL fold metallo-hydrolase, partial [Clostridia bacterium]